MEELRRALGETRRALKRRRGAIEDKRGALESRSRLRSKDCWAGTETEGGGLIAGYFEL